MAYKRTHGKTYGATTDMSNRVYYGNETEIVEPINKESNRLGSALIKTLKTFMGINDIYPITLTKAVYDENGNRLDNVLADMQRYSTEERVVGTWIDGKPLYQKTINFGNLPNNTTKSVKHNIANAETIWIDFGNSFVKSTEGYFQGLNLTNNSLAGQWRANIDITNIIFWAGSDRTTQTAIVTVRYTKTTD